MIIPTGLTYVATDATVPPAQGSLRYDPTTGDMQVFDGTRWMVMTNSGTVQQGLKFAQHGQSVVLVNYNYWAEHEQELEDWLDENVEGGRDCHQGMTVTFNNMEDLLVFTLKWS